MKFNNNDIVAIKMSNGDEIVATLLESFDSVFDSTRTTIDIKKPLHFHLVPTQNGFQIGAIPYLLATTEDNIQIRTSNIIILNHAKKDAKDVYIRQTSPIVPVTTDSKLII